MGVGWVRCVSVTASLGKGGEFKNHRFGCPAWTARGHGPDRLEPARPAHGACHSGQIGPGKIRGSGGTTGREENVSKSGFQDRPVDSAPGENVQCKAHEVCSAECRGEGSERHHPHLTPLLHFPADRVGRSARNARSGQSGPSESPGGSLRVALRAPGVSRSARPGQPWLHPSLTAHARPSLSAGARARTNTHGPPAVTRPQSYPSRALRPRTARMEPRPGSIRVSLRLHPILIAASSPSLPLAAVPLTRNARARSHARARAHTHARTHTQTARPSHSVASPRVLRGLIRTCARARTRARSARARAHAGMAAPAHPRGGGLSSDSDRIK